MIKPAALLFTMFLLFESVPVFGQTAGAGGQGRGRAVPPLRGAVRSRRTVPPPPPLSVRGSHHRSTKSAMVKSQRDPYAGDPTGRVDLAGKPVRFYPSARQSNAVLKQESATRTNTKRSAPTPKKDAGP